MSTRDRAPQSACRTALVRFRFLSGERRMMIGPVRLRLPQAGDVLQGGPSTRNRPAMGEIHGLAWADVDLDAQPCTITVRRSWRGKPKSAASAATLPLNSDSAALLRRWRAEQGQSAVYIFPARDGSLRRAERRAETVTLERAAKAAGVGKNVSPHVLRHTYGTWIYERTSDPKILQRLMRHASFQTSMGYVHDRRELATVVNQLPAMSPARLQSV